MCIIRSTTTHIQSAITGIGRAEGAIEELYFTSCIQPGSEERRVCPPFFLLGLELGVLFLLLGRKAELDELKVFAGLELGLPIGIRVRASSLGVGFGRRRRA